MSDKSLLQLPLAVTAAGALVYGVQDNKDVAIPASVLQGSEQPQPANTVYAGPTAPPGNFPTFRPLVANDIPDLSGTYMAATGGTLSGATLNNSTILGGTISGATGIFDEDKFTLRDATDTTRTGRFNVDIPVAGTSVTWTLPSTTAALVGRDTADTLTNKKIVLDASTTATAALRITPGQPPSAPVNGDVWTTNAGMFAQINNSTVGPFAAATSSTVNSWNGRVGAVTMTNNDVTTALGYTPWNTNTNLTTSANLSIGSLTTTGPNTLNGTTNLTGVLTVSSDLYAEGAIITGTNPNANLTIASDVNNVYVEAINRASSTRKTLNLYCAQGTLTCSNGQYYIDKSDGSNKVRFFSDGANMQLQAVNAGANAFTPLILNGNEVQLRSSGNVNLTAMPGVNSGGSGVRFQANMPNSNPANGVNSLGFVSSGGWGGGYGMVEGGVSSGIFMESGVVFIGYGDVGAPLARSLSLDKYGNLSVAGAITADRGFGPGSDPRLKVEESLKPIDNAVNTLYNLNVRKGKYHDWYNPDGKERYFVMADSAMKHFAPEAVLENAIERDGVKYDAWSSDQVIALLVKSVQELKDEIDTLKEKLNEYSH